MKPRTLQFTALLALVAVLGCRQVLGIDSEPALGDADSGVGDSDASGRDDAARPDGGGGKDAGGDAEISCDGPCPIEILADNLGQGTVVAVDSNNVYFADEATGDGIVYQCAKAGCGGAKVTLGPGYARAIGVDGTRVYWSDPIANTVVACAIGGCANAPTSIAGTQLSAGAVAFDGTNLSWSSLGTIVTCVAATCTTRKTLAQDQGNARWIAAESGTVYWISDVGNGAAFSCPATGCAAPERVGSGGGPGIAVKNGVKYWIAGNAIVSCATATCASPFTVGSSTQPHSVGTDGEFVYWRDDAERKVLRAHRTGTGGVETFANDQQGLPSGNVALDGQYAYWATAARVLRRRK